VLGVVVAVRGIVAGTGVEGWTSTIVMLSFLNGTVILMVSMLGEYVIRTLNQVSDIKPYYVTETVTGG